MSRPSIFNGPRPRSPPVATDPVRGLKDHVPVLHRTDVSMAPDWREGHTNEERESSEENMAVVRGRSEVAGEEFVEEDAAEEAAGEAVEDAAQENAAEDSASEDERREAEEVAEEDAKDEWMNKIEESTGRDGWTGVRPGDAEVVKLAVKPIGGDTRDEGVAGDGARRDNNEWRAMEDADMPDTGAFITPPPSRRRRHIATILTTAICGLGRYTRRRASWVIASICVVHSSRA